MSSVSFVLFLENRRVSQDMGVSLMREKGDMKTKPFFSSTPKIYVIKEEYSSTFWGNGEQIVFLTENKISLVFTSSCLIFVVNEFGLHPLSSI